MRAKLIRHDFQEKETLGTLIVVDENEELVYECKTLELPWRDNQRNISCIPPGTYKVRHRSANESGSFKYSHFMVMDVPNRDYILIHAGNYYSQLHGCILPGRSHVDINGDGLQDVTRSRDTLEDLVELFKHCLTFELTIINLDTVRLN